MPKTDQLLTNAEMAVLSLVAEQPMHGYQIEQIIASRGMREWTEIGFSSIYYILSKLKKQGYLTGRLEPAEGKGPSRQIFSLTTAGTHIFHQAALNALACPSRSLSNFQLGLAVLPLLSQSEALSALQGYAAFLENKIFVLKSKKEGYIRNLPWHIHAMFDHDLTLLDCEFGWLKKLIHSLEADEHLQLE